MFTLFVVVAASYPERPSEAPAASLDAVALFWLGCSLWFLWKLWRGWSAGLWRGLFSWLAIIFAFIAALVGGPWVGALVREVIPALPDPLASWLAGVSLALVVYNVISGIGRLFFKPTKDYIFPPTKLFVGAGGACCGLVAGLVGFWLVTLGVRLLGAAAEGNLAGRNASRTNGASGRGLVETLVEIKRSLEGGISGQFVEWTDPFSPRTLRLSHKIAEVTADPESVRRLADAVVRQGVIGRDSRLARLADDPQIRKLLADKNYPALLREPRVADALRDPQLRHRLASLDLERALDEALGKN